MCSQLQDVVPLLYIPVICNQVNAFGTIGTGVVLIAEADLFLTESTWKPHTIRIHHCCLQFSEHVYFHQQAYI